MRINDMSTRKLKRYYIRNLRRAWRYQEWRMVGSQRNAGISGLYWEAHDAAMSAHEELKRRGVAVP